MAELNKFDALWDDSPVDVTQEANFIWSIANKLRGSYMQDKYGDVIILVVIIRRFECALEDIKKAVLDTYKNFYALRPFLAAQYIEKYHDIPPVLFDDLLKMDISSDLRSRIDDLLVIKKRTTEGEENPHIHVIQKFITEETLRQKEHTDNLLDDHNKDITALNKIFREIISACRSQSIESQSFCFVPP